MKAVLVVTLVLQLVKESYKVEHVKPEEVAHIQACQTEALVWQLAWSREYRGRVEQELKARLDLADVSAFTFGEISVKQGRVVDSFTFTKSDRARIKGMVDPDEVEEFWNEKKDAASRPWLSISVKEKETDDETISD
jgi:hypothetical protein